MMLRSGFDIVNEWFESDKIKIHLLKFVSENLQGPEENGTGIGLVAMLGLAHTSGVGLPKGGSGKLTEALVKCIESFGGTIVTGADVTKFHLGGGRVTGVETTAGERYDARDAVIGAIHPHVLSDYFPTMNADVAERARQTQSSPFTLMNTHYALNQRAHFRGDGEILHNAYMIELVPTDMDKFRRSFDDLRYRRLADPITTFSLGIQSDHDPGRVPPGKSNLYFMAFATYDLASRENWDEIKWRFADQMIRDVGVWVDNLTPDNIIARHVDSPLDLERSSNSFRRGDIHGLGPYFYQMNGHRPTPDLAQYKIPGIDRFYLVGPFMHPGGGVFGAGRGAAIAICRDLKIDFDKLTK
jgi:phytoene dehydrogenase-like protein